MGNTQFGEVTGRQLFDKVRVTVFNQFGVNVGGVPVRYDDTAATYLLVTDDKIAKAKHKSISDFVAGVVACYKSF